MGRGYSIDKRGQIFSFLLVVVVLMMIGTVIVIYSHGQNKVDAAVVSPIKVLQVRDNLENFENQEKAVIISSLNSASGDFGTQEFYDSFRSDFLDSVYNNQNMRDFIFSNLTVGGSEIDEVDKNQYLINSVVYPESDSGFSGKNITFYRAKIGKRILLKVDNDNDINFPVRMNFEFDRKYLIERIDGKYRIEVIE